MTIDKTATTMASVSVLPDAVFAKDDVRELVEMR
jgi:hypothetical protein